MEQRLMPAVALARVVALALWLNAAAAFARGTPESPTDLEAALTRVDEGGGVTITAVHMTPDYLMAFGRADLEAGPDGGTFLVFRLILDTHAGDLMAYDLSRLALLRPGPDGPLAPVDWIDDVTGSHHRSGYLRFPGALPPGQAQVELVLRDVGGVPERVIRW